MKFKIENLCGYTANKPPMQAGKIKKALNGKRVKFIFVGEAISEAGNKAEWIVNTIYGESCYPKSYIRSGKAEYWLVIPNVNRGYKINKIEYDFAVWLTENFKTFPEALKAESDIAESLRLKQEAEEKAKAEQEQKQAAELQAKQDFEKVALAEVQKLRNTRIYSVYTDIFGKAYGEKWLECCDGHLRMLILYVCAKEIENPIAKKIVIGWLNNHNKSCIKFFEAITGIKMPKAYGKRVEVINSLTADKINLMQP